MSKKKRNIIILSSVLVAVIGLLIVLLLTTFSLKSIKIDFRTSTLNVTATEEEIIESGEFSKSCVLFYNKKQAKEKIEKAHPYLRVVNIETIFPSSFVVHVAERQEVFVVTDRDKMVYLDETLKVLRISEDNFVNSQDNPILLKGVALNEDLGVGQTLAIENYVDIYSAFLQSNLTLAMQKEIFKDVEFKLERDENAKTDYLNVYISLFSGQTIKIVDVNYGLKYKANRAINVYSALYTFIGQNYNISEEQSQEISKEMLDNVTIRVQSYYDRAHHNENETYFILDFDI